MAVADSAEGTETKPTETRRLRALAFAGGAFDTIMQMGVVHALLVSRGKAPDHVVGISAGAVNAAALAEVMQEGKTLSGRDRLNARVRKLREIVDTYLELRRTFTNSAFPDAFEINAKRPLRPLELPVHLPEERKSRADASRSKAGLIRLMNDVLGIRLTVGAATRMIRRILAFRQADELSRPAAPRDTIVVNAVFLWLHIGRHIVAMAEIFAALFFATWSGKKGGVMRWMQSLIPAALKRIRLKQLAETLSSRMSVDAATAGEAIQRPLVRTLAAAMRAGFGFLLFVVLWLVPLVLLSPPDGLMPELPRPAVRVEWREIATISRKAIETAAGTILNLSSQTIAENLRGIWHAFVPVVSGVAVWAWDVIAVRWVPIAGTLLPILVALVVERYFRFRAAAIFLGLWVLVISFTDWWRMGCLWAIVLVVCLVIKGKGKTRRRILEHYEIHDAVLSADVLQQALVHCFDGNYYGHAGLMPIIDAALKREPGVTEVDQVARKTLGDYTDPRKTDTPIHVAPVAANICDGQLEILDPQVAVVDALLAATAVVPVFPAKEIETQSQFAANQKKKDWYIDGLNVSNEPIQPLFRHIRAAHDANAAKYGGIETLDVYPVSDVPVDEVLRQDGDYSTLVDVGLRALELKQFRDAAMERRLTRLYTRALPAGTAFHRVALEDPDEKTTQRTFIHAGLFPIELEKPARVNRRLFRNPTPEDFKRILRETVADGCRAALEAMLPATLYSAERQARIIDWTEGLVEDMVDPRFDLVARVRNAPDFPQNVVAAAALAVNAEDGVAMTFQFEKNEPEKLRVTPNEFNQLREIIYPRCMDVIESLVGGDHRLPGSDRAKGPGLSEICKSCRLNRPDEASSQNQRRDDAGGDFDLQRLRVIPARSEWPQWPFENPLDARQPAAERPVACGTVEPPKPDPAPYREWLGNRSDRPLVSLLFGGGVFRGVFHMGVMNALSEAGLEPDLVAGSSVGSIVAAMIAGTFKESGDARQHRIALLAATFLAIDRLVLTDRLSDFVRGFTLRAAEARFSPRDIDRALRQFDSDDPKEFNRRLRKVAAGLERLFYLSPSELIRMIDDVRMRRTASMTSELIQDVQELLERGGLGQEILGSEALSLLIDHHVIRGGKLNRFASFRDGQHGKIFFLATATNLVQGGLEILGAPWNDPNVDVQTGFGLLASSAFPAVFRPRHAWEVFVKTDRGDDKYIDGGTIDNLPLDAVARFLSEASKSGVVNSRHGSDRTPHLLFTASLEVNEAIHDVSAGELEREATEFLSLMRRAGRFKYNRKIDAYVSVQRRLRWIRAKFGPQRGWEPLNMHVLAVKPNWLCGTFGFHPMLGFKRRKQAQSIAHGCAMTLAMLNGTREKRPTWYDEWTTRPLQEKKELRFDPQSSEVDKAGRVTLRPQPRTDGRCWFRTGVVCPFSDTSTRQLNAKLAKDDQLTDTAISDLHRIYAECGLPETHRPLQ